jgi:hypothetical protein
MAPLQQSDRAADVDNRLRNDFSQHRNICGRHATATASAIASVSADAAAAASTILAHQRVG